MILPQNLGEFMRAIFAIQSLVGHVDSITKFLDKKRDDPTLDARGRHSRRIISNPDLPLRDKVQKTLRYLLHLNSTQRNPVGPMSYIGMQTQR